MPPLTSFQQLIGWVNPANPDPITIVSYLAIDLLIFPGIDDKILDMNDEANVYKDWLQ